jgi:hypothetical protein
MSHSHLPAATTHTVELRQIREINVRLEQADRDGVTAEHLGVAGQQASLPQPRHFDFFGAEPPAAPILRPASVLHHISAEGCVGFPYLRGHFADDRSPRQPDLVVELHTEALRRLSRLLALQHRWGISSATS